ncbi:Sec34-domain-containing protein [Athelia psychrophila]|uniref:Conserved oligomeric Golgi complex subunit 3 n=1 Tax=Athelia psychrophila TaxID=1759441 RepID=A0A166KVN1_9AGAM|nr:Sec34-domain-containing protein [Fibularhizoctonia sp. CBS 109695]
MAANRAGNRRGAAPLALPTLKLALSVEEWESRAPLGDAAIKSVNALKAAGEIIPLPLKFSADEAGASRPTTPAGLRGAKIGSGSRPSTPTGRPPAAHALHPKQPVQTPQQFYDWFALIDRSVAHSQESHFRAHVASVTEHLETCDRLTERIDEVDNDVEGMLEGWRSVEEGGRSLKDACERLLQERDSLLQLTEDIGARLEYFQELEYATRMLNHPGESLVLQGDFLYMVERVDVCIDYLKAHRQFREAEIYLLRFQQCMTRAMTLIKMYFVGSLRALTAEVSRRMSEKDVSQTAQMHLLYTRFKSVSNRLAPLLGELERRAAAHPEELSALLSECHTAYFSARKGLLIGRLIEEIRGLDPERTELVELTRSGCSYLKQVCLDEFNVYRAFFSSGEEQLYAYLETLCDYLYDDLRPRILHEPRLTALCEVCTVLQALMVLDVPSSAMASSTSSASDADSDGDEEDDDDDDDLTVDLDTPKKGLGRLHISHLLQMVLQDAQTRLFFKAQSVIQSDIRYFVPKAEDLAYPDKLVAARKPLTGLEIREKESISQLFQLPSLDKQETWFPTLRKTIWVLSQLHDFVNPAIFEDIAQEAISLCRQSFISAAELIKSKNTPSSTMDAHLFLARHLLILKEMTHNLDFVQRDVQPTIDLGGVTETLASILNRTTSLLPSGLFASLGMPRGAENLGDAKHGIDHELKQACEDIIFLCSDQITSPLRQWTSRVQSQIDTQGSAPSANAHPALQETFTEDSARKLHEDFYLACERDLRSNVSRLRLYLEDDRTVGVLLGHVMDRIVDEYAEYREVVWKFYAGALREVLFNTPVLRANLRGICEENTVIAASTSS